MYLVQLRLRRGLTLEKDKILKVLIVLPSDRGEFT